MALATYTDLQSSVANWLHRSDSNLIAAIPDFITLCEARYEHEFNGLWSQMTTATGTTAANDTSFALPDDFKRIYRLTVTQSGTDYEVEYSAADDIAKYNNQSGVPLKYALINQQGWWLPKPDGVYTYTIFYYAKFPSLGPSSASNWLLANAPDVYLYGTLLEAAPFMKDQAMTVLWKQAFESAVAGVINDDEQVRKPGGVLVIRSDQYSRSRGGISV